MASNMSLLSPLALIEMVTKKIKFLYKHDLESFYTHLRVLDNVVNGCGTQVRNSHGTPSKASGKLNDHITSMIQVNESFYKSRARDSIAITNNIEATQAHINNLVDTESVKEYISKLRQKIKTIGNTHTFHLIVQPLTLCTDDILQRNTQQQQLRSEKALDVTHLKIKLVHVITSLDALEVSWQQVLPITDYLYSLKLYIYNPILELLEAKQEISNMESLKDSDNIYTKLEHAVAVYQEIKNKKHNKYR